MTAFFIILLLLFATGALHRRAIVLSTITVFTGRVRPPRAARSSRQGCFWHVLTNGQPVKLPSWSGHGEKKKEEDKLPLRKSKRGYRNAKNRRIFPHGGLS
jgi:hypothetical protein